MVEIKEDFRLRLQFAMDHAGIKAIDLARKTGISEATISQYRSGYSKPKDQRLVLIANALNVDPAWLMGLNVSMASAPKADPILSDRDAALLEKYHALNSAGKDKLDERVEELIRMDYTVEADAKKGGSVSA